MEKLYRKIKKGNRYIYEEYGYGSVPDLVDGIWLIQSGKSYRSQTSLVWKVGDLKRPSDIVTHASLQTMERELCEYLLKLSDEKSEEFKEAKETLGWTFSQPIIYNASISSITTLFIREIAKKLEQGEFFDFNKVFFNFRDTLDINSQNYRTQVKTLYDLADWLEKNKYYLNKKL